jgi:ribosome-associated protein
MKENATKIVNVNLNNDDKDYITLGSLLKFMNIIQSGGHSKFFLLSNSVFVNGEKENRRGRKIRTGDVVKINDEIYQINS